MPVIHPHTLGMQRVKVGRYAVVARHDQIRLGLFDCLPERIRWPIGPINIDPVGRAHLVDRVIFRCHHCDSEVRLLEGDR